MLVDDELEEDPTPDWFAALANALVSRLSSAKLSGRA